MEEHQNVSMNYQDKSYRELSQTTHYMPWAAILSILFGILANGGALLAYARLNSIPLNFLKGNFQSILWLVFLVWACIFIAVAGMTAVIIQLANRTDHRRISFTGLFLSTIGTGCSVYAGIWMVRIFYSMYCMGTLIFNELNTGLAESFQKTFHSGI
ncbi:MAG TPA: hypothetical protein PLI09_24460 [Candidatus Hydrogenedentes bacterium]|nr:hypothetical protein [Candidatus Hydrogenedentota bacterium]